MVSDRGRQLCLQCFRKQHSQSVSRSWKMLKDEIFSWQNSNDVYKVLELDNSRIGKSQEDTVMTTLTKLSSNPLSFQRLKHDIRIGESLRRIWWN